ncbi:MAG: ABC transporter permease [Planctomycetes bacterium]|nr:ABC transporter permease [Planctomycetota bacterium]
MRAVLERDFLVLTSAKKYVMLRTAVVAVMAILAVAILLTMGVVGSIGRTSPDDIGRAVFTGFAVAFPILVLVVGPALGSGAIAGERALDTLQLVLAAPVRPGAFVLAKFLSRLGAMLIPLVGGLPIAAICFLYGGISVSLFVTWMGLVLALASIAAASSILASAYSRSMSGAITLAYFLAVVVPLLESWLSCWLLWDVYVGSGPSWIASHTPVVAFGTIIEAVVGRGTTRSEVWPFFVAAGLGSIVALALASARLSREAASLASAGPRRGRTVRTIFRNPVLDRATLGVPFRRAGVGAWATWLVIGGLTWLIPLVADFDDDAIIAGMNIATWGTAIVLLARSSQAISVERQQGSLALLCATRLSAGEILRGKLLGLVVHGAVLLVPAIALAIVGSWHGVKSACLPAWLASTGVALLLFSSIGLRVSSTSATPGRAAGMSYAIALGSLVAHGFALLVAGMAGAWKSEDLMAALVTMSPPVNVTMASVSAQHGASGGSERQFLAWGLFWSVAHVILSLGLLRSAAVKIQTDDE